jgi:hypothetical protein
MVIYVLNAAEAGQLPPDAPLDARVAASIEDAVHLAAIDDEIRLLHGPFICRPLLFDGKRIKLKGVGRRAEGPGRRVIVIFSTACNNAPCVTVSDGSVSFEECVLMDGHDGESVTMSSVQARIKLLDRAMGRHLWQRYHDADRHSFHAAVQGCGALFNELQRICQWEKSNTFVMETECAAAVQRLLQAGMLQCGESSSMRGDTLMTASAVAKSRDMPPLLQVIKGHLQLSRCEVLHRSPLQLSLHGSGGSCTLSGMQSVSAVVACGTFKLELSHVRVCDPSSGGSCINAHDQSEVTAEDCVLSSGVTCASASDNCTLTLLRCAVYDAQVSRKPPFTLLNPMFSPSDAQRCAVVARHNAAVDVIECVIGRAQVSPSAVLLLQAATHFFFILNPMRSVVWRRRAAAACASPAPRCMCVNAALSATFAPFDTLRMIAAALACGCGAAAAAQCRGACLAAVLLG